MAILKHVPIRNSDYGATQKYLLFEHDESTNKPVRDDYGNMIPRQGILQSSMNCDPFTFNTECTELNRAFRKNNSKRDVKAHHFIISFDPKDVEENGLTAQRAHKIGTEFAERFFAGHQALIVTHPDGHNKSGNIHVHIVINSLRKNNVAWQSFMERPIDALAGYKHHQTPLLLKHQEDYLNEICAREHLHLTDFVSRADRKVTDREYKAKRHGQRDLDRNNEGIIRDGLNPRVVDFSTVKDEIRKAIDEAIRKVKTEEEFKRLLQDEWHITLKESRGVWSYIHPNRQKPIRARSLGRIYEKNAVLNRIAGIEDIDRSRPEYAGLPRIFFIHSELKLVVDIQNCVKAQQSRAYARKVEISNLQQIARSVAYIQEQGIGTYDELTKRLEAAEKEYNELIAKQQENKRQLTGINETIHYLGQYLSVKKTYREFLKSTDKKTYRDAHREQLERYEIAASFLKAKYEDDAFPSIVSLKEKRKQIGVMPNETELRVLNKRMKTLQIVQKNVYSVLSDMNSVHTAINKDFHI